MFSNRRKYLLIPSLALTCSLLYYISLYHYQLRNTISYATRPLWDHADGPRDIIAHYYAEGMSTDAHACALHDWLPRQPSQDGHHPVVLDAVLMSNELDLLEIRMNELDNVVDRFLIVESNATFTGLRKETYYADARLRFERFEHKIVYRL